VAHPEPQQAPSLTPAIFRGLCPVLEHYSLSASFRLDAGLLTSAQVLEANADAQGIVWTKFRNDDDYRPHAKDYWKTHSRFKRHAGENGCNILVRDVADHRRSFFLSSNYPLGPGMCLGTTIPLTDNRPGDPHPSREDWFSVLNSMFWVFDPSAVNSGVLRHLRTASQNEPLLRLRLETGGLIGILEGISAPVCAELVATGALTLAYV
jgi:hypothetical protein